MHDIGSRHLWEWLLSILFSFIHFYFEVTKISEIFRKRIMLRRMYQGGYSAKKGPRIAIREQDVELPRDANIRACEWPFDDFMVEAGFNEEFDAYVRNAELEDFLQDKCPRIIN